MKKLICYICILLTVVVFSPGCSPDNTPGMSAYQQKNLRKFNNTNQMRKRNLFGHGKKSGSVNHPAVHPKYRSGQW